MVDWIQHKVTKGELQRWRVAEYFKQCPLCETLNSIESTECVTCTWSGKFEFDADVVEAGFAELLMACPELRETFAPNHSKGMSLKVRIRQWWRSLFWRRLDFRA